MNRIKHLFTEAALTLLPLLAVVAGTLLCSSCENDDNWTPGEAVPEGTPIVYFSSDNPATIINLGEESATFSLTVERLDSVGELQVPIVVTSKVGEMDVPSSVTFHDGERQAHLDIAYTYTPGMSLALSIGAGYGNPYLEQDGTINYMCNMARLKRIARVKYRDDSTLGAVKSYIFSYEGLNQFVFSNFMDSGLDVTFTIDTSHSGVTFDANDLRSLKGDFVPQDSYYYDGSGWYLYNDKEDDYPTWTPAGWTKPVMYYYYYGYSEDYDYSYSYIDFSNKKYSYFYGSSFFFDENFEDFTTIAIYYSFDFNDVSE